MFAKSHSFQSGTAPNLNHMSPAVPPLATLALASVLAYHFGLHPSLEVEDTVAFGGTIASVGSTMLGFMLASLAVLASINHTHLVGMMKKNGHYEDLLLTVFVGALVFLICATGGFALIFGANPSSWLLSLVVGCHLAALVSLLDVGRKFWLVLSSLR